jgi:hypothetical protein
MTNKMIKKIIGSLLLFLLTFVLLSCNQSTKKATQLPDDITEDIINEDIINQVINEEIYLKEIIVVENKVSEMLIQDEKIEEVVICKSIYINEENIDEFSKHSQTAELFGSNIDIEPLMAKISIGTGVILTLTILKVTNVSGLFGGIVVSAAPKAIKGALSGAGIGSLIGALTGTIDSIDETGRTTAVLNFAASVVGVIATAISMINAPLGIAIAGITVAAGLAAFEGYKMVKKITTTNYATIDWNNVLSNTNHTVGGVLTLPTGIADGEYRLYVGAKCSREKCWRLVRRSEEQVNSYQVTIADGAVKGVVADTDDTWESTTTAIKAVITKGTNAPSHYFDLQGREVNGSTKGLVIRKQGDEVKKVIVR